MLARREHSTLELRRKLQARSIDAGLIDEVLAQLADEGLLSEQRFTEAYVRGRCERGYGPLRIRAELRERGIGDGLIEVYLSPWSECWPESAEAQRRKRFGEALPQDFRERARQTRFLQQRGFSGEHIRALFDEP
ncbi:MAG TPA: regulatory protein RecX [Gammaproteobacteria bacterium]|nr:regulatory protein RecX [Gammaproteobacteria bacterium]